jgi:hypothetical protein
MLLCDICNAGYHTFCLQPTLTSIPEGCWVCPVCEQRPTTTTTQQHTTTQLTLLADALVSAL